MFGINCMGIVGKIVIWSQFSNNQDYIWQGIYCTCPFHRHEGNYQIYRSTWRADTHHKMSELTPWRICLQSGNEWCYSVGPSLNKVLAVSTYQLSQTLLSFSGANLPLNIASSKDIQKLSNDAVELKTTQQLYYQMTMFHRLTVHLHEVLIFG